MISGTELSRQILQLAQQGYTRLGFLERLSSIVTQFTGCEGIEIRLADNAFPYSWKYENSGKCILEEKIFITDKDGLMLPCEPVRNSQERLIRDLFQRRYNPELKYYYSRSSIIMEDAQKDNAYHQQNEKSLAELTSCNSLIYCSFITIREINGLLILKHSQREFFKREKRLFYEGLAASLGIAIAFQRSQYALRERVKELTCLHSINKLLQENNLELASIAQRIVNKIPASFQYPGFTCCLIKLENKTFRSQNFTAAGKKISSPIYLENEKAGKIEVFLHNEEDMDFLPEEYDLLSSISTSISAIYRKIKYEEEKKNFQEQIRHADRLATIGQLAAGIAHELNEPLANILGYAELIEQDVQNLPALGDIKRIIESSLHARDVVRKLLLFSRQMPTHLKTENLNDIIKESLQFLENRLRRGKIELSLKLSSQILEIIADASQIKQIIINLIVNAQQAMPKGGNICISTGRKKNFVYFKIKDTGIGMSRNILKKIYLPFFTTKKPGEGTGLGLSVAFGIIKAHNGKCEVSSQIDKGTEFTVMLPQKEKPISQENKK